MHHERRLAAALCLAATLSVSLAQAQTAPAPASASPSTPAGASAGAAPETPAAAPDTLETPYGESSGPGASAPATDSTAAPAVAPPPTHADEPSRPAHLELAPAPADTRPPVPIRARRKLALLGELGWNGLAGFGAILTYHVDPHASLDLGAGLSLLGPKVGVRARYNFLTEPFTPFLGVGFNATSGLGQVTTDPQSESTGDPNREPATIDVKASYLIQGVLGFDFVHRRGFTMVGCIGYAWLLNHDNVDLLAGTLSSEERKGFDIAFKSGPVVSLAAGYAFE